MNTFHSNMCKTHKQAFSIYNKKDFLDFLSLSICRFSQRVASVPARHADPQAAVLRQRLQYDQRHKSLQHRQQSGAGRQEQEKEEKLGKSDQFVYNTSCFHFNSCFQRPIHTIG